MKGCFVLLLHALTIPPCFASSAVIGTLRLNVQCWSLGERMITTRGEVSHVPLEGNHSYAYQHALLYIRDRSCRAQSSSEAAHILTYKSSRPPSSKFITRQRQ